MHPRAHDRKRCRENEPGKTHYGEAFNSTHDLGTFVDRNLSLVCQTSRTQTLRNSIRRFELAGELRSSDKQSCRDPVSQTAEDNVR